MGFPLGYFSAALGAMSLAALALFGLYIDLGLGQGGMERLILYPVLIWIMTLGAPLASQIQVTGKAVS